MEENKEQQKKVDSKAIQDAIKSKSNLLNICVLGFSVILTAVALLAFFITLFRDDVGIASAITSLYVLCMLLAAPTLKVFMDKATCPNVMMLNKIGVIMIFGAILIQVVLICLAFAFNF